MVFGVISNNYLYLNLSENAERTARYLEFFWMEVFVQ